VQALKTNVRCKSYEFCEFQEKLEETGETLRRVLSDEEAFQLDGNASHDNFRA
jgi:hypothetical protein